jgi:hypothetical protein
MHGGDGKAPGGVMKTFTPEYLSTDYRPDVNYVDGEIAERNVGEKGHSRLQMLLSAYLFNREAEYSIHVLSSSGSRFRRRVSAYTIFA